MSELLRFSPEEIVITQRLKREWWATVVAEGGNETEIDAQIKRLVEAYASRGNDSYHNLHHISQMRSFLHRHIHLMKNVSAMSLAYPGHDVVYEPLSSTNEEDSVAFMAATMSALKLPDHLVEEVSRLIMLTKNHQASDDDADGKLLIDADFSILAATAEEYDRYVAGVWHEYVDSGLVKEEDFMVGREKLVKEWLKRDKLFLTEEIREKLQEKARSNLKRELRGACKIRRQKS